MNGSGWAALRGAATAAVLGWIGAGCGQSGGSTAPAVEGPNEAGGASAWVYRCPDDDSRFAATFANDSVHLLVDDRPIAIPRLISASGARYGDAETTFWGRGREATLTTPQGVRTGCVGEPAETVWAVARLLGNDYRGVGQEPGWLVEIDAERRIRLLLDYGERVVLTGPPAAEASGDTTVWRGAGIGGEVVVRVEARPCEDVMSGEAYPTRVIATVGDTRYEGCGRQLDGRGESLLTAHRWTLVELEGEPVMPTGSATPDLQLTEIDDRIEGETGCNRYFGSFARDGERLRFPPPIGATRRACADAAGAALERRFLEMLGRVDRFRFEEGALVLYAGAEALARFSRP